MAAKPMDGLGESPEARANFCGLVLDPPRREAARFSGLVEKDDVAVGVAQASLAPHPRLVPGPVLERDALTSQLLDPLVEVVAFQIDRGSRHDLLLRIDLHGESGSSAGFESCVIRRVCDDLGQPKPAVEIDGAL